VITELSMFDSADILPSVVIVTIMRISTFKTGGLGDDITCKFSYMKSHTCTIENQG
jgi:hypothetical protein